MYEHVNNDNIIDWKKIKIKHEEISIIKMNISTSMT